MSHVPFIPSAVPNIIPNPHSHTTDLPFDPNFNLELSLGLRERSHSTAQQRISIHNLHNEQHRAKRNALNFTTIALPVCINRLQVLELSYVSAVRR